VPAAALALALLWAAVAGGRGAPAPLRNGVLEAEAFRHRLFVEHAGFHDSESREEYEFAVFRVAFDSALRVEIADGSGFAAEGKRPRVAWPSWQTRRELTFMRAGDESIERPGVYPEEVATSAPRASGLVQMRCEERTFESVPRSAADTSADLALGDLATHLVLGDSVGVHYPHSLLLSLGNVLPPMNDTKQLVAVLLVEARARLASRSGASTLPQRFVALRSLDASLLTSCRLLAAAPPAGAAGRRLALTSGRAALGAPGDGIAFMWSNEQPAQRDPAPMQATASIEISRRIASRRIASWIPKLGWRPLVDPLVALEERARERATHRDLLLSPLNGPAISAVKGAVSGIVSAMKEAVGSSLLASLTSALLQGVEGSFADQMLLKFVPQTTVLMSMWMVPSLIEALSERLLLQMPSDMSDQVADAVVRDVAARLVRALSDEAGSKVNDEVVGEAPAQTAQQSMLSLTHTLSRTLPHTIVPALISTISHSASQDYLCYACFNEGKNCRYCHYADVKLVYGNFYASYFSQHYGDYFGDYYRNYFGCLIEPEGCPDGQPRASQDGGDARPDSVAPEVA
jgi:hypothetical protein